MRRLKAGSRERRRSAAAPVSLWPTEDKAENLSLMCPGKADPLPASLGPVQVSGGDALQRGWRRAEDR